MVTSILVVVRTDTVSDTSGRQLFDLCSNNTLSIVNLLPCARGSFSRVEATVAGKRETTIDYVLVPTERQIQHGI